MEGLIRRQKYTNAADLSLKHAVLGYRPEDISGHLENIVFTELLYRGYNVYVGNYNGKEIDIVAKKPGKGCMFSVAHPYPTRVR